MRSTVVGALALAFLVSSPSLGGDDPKGPKKKAADVDVMSEPEWFAKLKEIDAVDSISIKKSDVLKKVVARTVVAVRVKIRDVRSTKQGVAIDVIDVVPTSAPGPRLSREPVVIPGEDAELIKDWKRWDRLAFRVKPKVMGDGAVEYDRLFRGAADIERTPNPGPEYLASEKTSARVDAFGAWCERYSRACEIERWKNAWRLYADAVDTTFPLTAVCCDAAPLDPRAMNGTAQHLFDFKTSTGVTGFGLVDAKGHPITRVALRVFDPQVEEILADGRACEIAARVHGLTGCDDLEVRKGRFRVEVAFTRLR